MEMPNARSVSYVVGTVCFRINGKFSLNCARIIVGDGRIVGEISPRTAINCHVSRNRNAVMAGSAMAGSCLDHTAARSLLKSKPRLGIGGLKVVLIVCLSTMKSMPCIWAIFTRPRDLVTQHSAQLVELDG